MTTLRVDEIGKVFLNNRQEPTAVISNLSFEVNHGEFLSIVGPSGCGKTTLLRCLSGLMLPSSGSVFLDDNKVTAPPVDMAFVFQDYRSSLLPWMTVMRNVTMPLSYKGIDAQRRDELAYRALGAVGLTEFRDYYPWQISGGMQQRVAIARALAYQPKVLFMDEPFASVDAQTRSELEDLALDIWRDFSITVVFVTHDVDEAVYLGDRVIVLGPSPTSVQRTISIDLPRPRRQLETKGTSGFAQLRSEVLREIRYSAGGGARNRPSVLE